MGIETPGFLARSETAMLRLLWLCVVLLVLTGARPALAKAAYVPMDEKVAACDLIAQVRVGSIRWKGFPSLSRYRFVARARVIRAYKGEPGREIEIEFDNGYVCPNVYYTPGEECVAFLAREPGGRYSTFNTYYGKYPVNGNTLAEMKPYLAPGRLEAAELLADNPPQPLRGLVPIIVGVVGPLLALQLARRRGDRLTRGRLLFSSMRWAGCCSLLTYPALGDTFYPLESLPYVMAGALVAAGVLIWVYRPRRGPILAAE
jgi:hypothetical protein